MHRKDRKQRLDTFKVFHEDRKWTLESPESRVKVGRSDSFRQRTFHQVPVHDGRSACLTVRKVSNAECGGLSGWRHVLLPLTVVANHDPWEVEMDRMEKMKAGPSFTVQRQPSR